MDAAIDQIDTGSSAPNYQPSWEAILRSLPFRVVAE